MQRIAPFLNTAARQLGKCGARLRKGAILCERGQGRVLEAASGAPAATENVPTATNKALPAPPKPNLRVNSSAPRRASPSTCGSSRQRRRTGAINPQVSWGKAGGKASTGRKSPSGVKAATEGSLWT
jgi:hypothetical protein